MTSFIPRTSFPLTDALPRSYFLGHHRAGLNKMKSLISQIDLVLECRDYRVPLCSRNPLFEQSLEGKNRLIVYTKRDLGSNETAADRKRENAMRLWHRPDDVIFSKHRDPKSVRKVLDYLKDKTAASTSLTGSRAMVVGMPNVGKSTLLNVLRQQGMHRGKAAKTGDQPGVTRSVETSVKIFEGSDESQTLYLVDTPGVFIPYVPNGESMLKLALCGSVKDSIIPPIILADYLLYQLNLNDPLLYKTYYQPTNDIEQLLTEVAHQTGRLQKGGVPDLEASAVWLIQRWRRGDLGRFVLDDVTQESLQEAQGSEIAISLSQARKSAAEAARQRRAIKHSS